ncbi:MULTISPECIES: hypothetical protein [unclassified Sphingomonas]|jgi:hypothetical protein|uniref:hypothetical protein n=1 Tax=unclassified Sphingomonas TaxID=196159 RepID=UPI002151DC0C|nr:MULTISPECIES: hypothetical protein [unclassified Sphingomonas]MCR5869545.1 hypothetical protein [Sphingomonas sp. J344]UUX98738.1 hypothetical protein LRS08_14585 [Sphingomonas sp. J315]
MEEETARFRCIGDDGTPLIVIKFRHSLTMQGKRGHRTFPGAVRLALSTGEAVRYIAPDLFEVVDTGELLHRL